MNEQSIFILETPKQTTFKTTYNYVKNLNICMPDCQRYVDNIHVNSVLQFQLDHFKQYGYFFFTNTIILAELDNTYYIIDGQHRLKCLELLENLGHKDIPIILVICRVSSIKELDDKYIAINKNKPVPLPIIITDWKKFGKHVEIYFYMNYQKYFSDSTRPNTPNFNIQLLIKYINENNIAIKIKYDYEKFIDEIEALNLYYLQTYDTTLIKYHSKNICTKISIATAKQPHKSLILGIFKHFEWVDRIVYKITTATPYENMEHMPVDYRVKIKTKLRREVWNKRFNKYITGECYVCSESIDYDNFQCGHITSVFYGGKSVLNNLEPICGKCNINMGIHDLNVYKSELIKELA
jgi:hypothetical protein